MYDRTIELVLDKSTGLTVDADVFFLQSENEIWTYRRRLEEVILEKKDPLFVCCLCGQKIKIRGGKDTKKILHFSHLKDSDDCILKTDNKLTVAEINRIKYNGAKESHAHYETKNLIAKLLNLNKSVSNIQIEKSVRNQQNYLNWRRPDVSVLYKNLNVVFEIQLSTTFLSVIVDRELFYKNNQTFILWIFRHFEIDEFKQRFTDKDIFYSNNRNAFVLNEEAVKISIEQENLYLLCYYQKFRIEGLKITYDWNYEYVAFDQLTFDYENYKLFYFNVEQDEQLITEQLNFLLETEQKKKEEENRKKQLEYQQIWEADESAALKQEEAELRFNKFLEDSEKRIKQNNLDFSNVNRAFLFRLRYNYHHHSPLQKVFLLPFSELPDALYSLFAHGYQISEKDRIFLKQEFEIEMKKKSAEKELEIIYYFALSTFYIKVKETKYMFLLPRIKSLLFGILSFKLKKVVGYKYANLLQIAHYILTRKEYSQVFLNAIEEYYGLDNFLAEDKNKQLRKKIVDYRNSKPHQYNEYSTIIELIFPGVTTKVVSLENI